MEKYYYVSFGADVYYDVDGEKYVRCGEDDISEYDTVIKCDQSEINDKADAILCDIPTYPEIMRLYEVEGPNGIPYDGQECDSARYFVRYSGDDGNDPTAVDPQTGLTQGDDADPITTALGWYPDWVDRDLLERNLRRYKMYYISFAYADKIYGGVSEADGLNEGGYGDLEGAEEAADRILENCSGVEPDLIRIFETEHETPVWGDLCEAYRWTDEDDWEYTAAEPDYNGADTMRWEEDDTYDE